MINKINFAKIHIAKPQRAEFSSLNPINFKGVNNKDVFVKSSAELQDKNIESSSSGLDFAFGVYQKINKDKKIDIAKEVQDFLKKNNIDNVKVAPLSEYKNAPPRVMGVFVQRYNSNMIQNGGTLYINNAPKNDDKKAMQVLVASVAHELQHVLQHQRDDLSSIFIDSLDNPEQVDLVFQYTQYLKSFFVGILQKTALQYCINNREQYGIDIPFLMNLNEDIYRYSMIFPNFSSDITDDTIRSSFSKDGDFSSLVAKNFDMIIENFASPDIEEFATNETYELIRKKIIYELRSEAQAYQVNSDLNKYITGIKSNQKTLNDLIPMTYNLVADELEKITKYTN